MSIKRGELPIYRYRSFANGQRERGPATFFVRLDGTEVAADVEAEVETAVDTAVDTAVETITTGIALMRFAIDAWNREGAALGQDQPARGSGENGPGAFIERRVLRAEPGAVPRICASTVHPQTAPGRGQHIGGCHEQTDQQADHRIVVGPSSHGAYR